MLTRVDVNRAAGHGALIGAVASGLVIAFILMGNNELVGVAFAAMGGVIGTVGSLVVTALISGRSLPRLESKLEKLQAMLERGLIDREEYTALKVEVLAKRNGGRPHISWLAVVMGILLGLVVGTGIDSLVWLLVMSGGLLGGALLGAGYTAVRNTIVNNQLPAPQQEHSPKLPAE